MNGVFSASQRWLCSEDCACAASYDGNEDYTEQCVGYHTPQGVEDSTLEYFFMTFDMLTDIPNRCDVGSQWTR